MSKPINTSMALKALAGLGLLSVAAACGGDESGGGGPLSSQLGFDEARSEVVVLLNREVGGGEKVHARVRSLADGDELDCSAMAGEIPTFGKRGGLVYGGEAVTEQMFEVPTTPNSLLGESDEELQTRLANTFYVDVCVENGGNVVHQARYSLNQALDRIGENGKFDADDDGVRIVSNSAYAQACEEELGPNPLFEKLAEGDYAMANCLDGTPIQTNVDGQPSPTKVDQCDEPQYIYSSCEADARTGANGPRVQSARNDQGTSWVLLCRKSLEEEGWYNDIAMIGHNPFTGKTCYFQNQLRGSNFNQTRDAKGTEVPWPGDTVDSAASPQGSVLWGAGPEGGSNKGIGCAGCHDADAFIHTPWIDSAKNEDGTTVIPKMGEHPDFVEGYNRPYSLVDQTDQGWTIPRRLVSEEASACTKCHSMNFGQWISPSTRRGSSDPNGEGYNFATGPWVSRMVGDSDTWARLVTDSHQGFEDVFWMPPNADEVLSEDTWEDSDYGKAVRFMLGCAENPEDPACIWENAPTEPGNPDELPTIETTGIELARASLAAMEMRHLDENNNVVDFGKRCQECHAGSRFGVRSWRDRTQEAVANGMDMTSDPSELSREQALALVNYMRKDASNPESVFAPYKIGIFSAGAQFSYFRKLFDTAFGADGGLQYSQFLARVSMPKGSHPPFSAEEFATVVKWFVDEDINHLEAVMPEAPRPETCADVNAYASLGTSGRPASDDWFQGHLDDMEFEGWHARNVEKGINMFGCNGSTDGSGCFDGFDRANGISNAIEGAELVLLDTFNFDTSYWMRSSADGRFVGNGGSNVDGYRASITDLIADRDIGVRGSYDPGFFPNNDGFIMQGGGAGLCGQSVLTNNSLIEDGIDFTEPGCSNASGINLYQHVAVNLDGGDYFIINSQFESDPGTGNQDPRAGFSETSQMKFSPLVFDGQDWDQKEAVDVDSPYEGDSVLSPSGRLVVSRFAKEGGESLGYMYRRVQASPSGGTYDISIAQPVRFACLPGAKANISFDERYSVTHHYEDGTANLYLTDLLTMNNYKITDMPGDTRALFPHFRSDGWIYFLAQGPAGDQGMAINSAVILDCINAGECSGTATPWTGDNSGGGDNGGGDNGGGDNGGGDNGGGDTGGDEWTCDQDYYDAQDGCDCGCGVPDPDCGGSTSDQCEYCDACGDGECTDIVVADDNTSCQ